MDINIKWVSLFLLVLQTTCTILITRYSRTSHDSKNNLKYLSSTAVLFSEILKVFICLIIVYINNGSYHGFRHAFNEQIINAPKEMAKILIPAALYTLQNNLIFLALSNLNAAIYQVTYQLKLFTTAFFSVLLLKRRLSVHKWISLALLMMGVVLVQLTPGDNGSTSKKQNGNQNTVVGIIAVLSACMCSGFSGVYFEKLLKNSTKISLWMRNIQLGLWGILIAFLGAIVYDYDKIKSDGFLQGYDRYTVIVIILQALGGLIIATVIKYADNIVKGFANAISISLSAMLSHYLLHDFEPTRLFAVGTLIVVSATVLYGYEFKTPSNTKPPIKSINDTTLLNNHLYPDNQHTKTPLHRKKENYV